MSAPVNANLETVRQYLYAHCNGRHDCPAPHEAIDTLEAEITENQRIADNVRKHWPTIRDALIKVKIEHGNVVRGDVEKYNAASAALAACRPLQDGDA